MIDNDDFDEHNDKHLLEDQIEYIGFRNRLKRSTALSKSIFTILKDCSKRLFIIFEI